MSGPRAGDGKVDVLAVEVVYPFVRCRVSVFDGVDGCTEIDSWKPGVEYREVRAGNAYYEPEAEAFADGVGRMLLTEVSRHRPGRYPERVFYTRAWVNPDGVTFGKPALRIATAEKFRRLCKGYQHPYQLTKVEESA